jgi:hypothetical protein
MDQIYNILLKKNLKHVVTVYDKAGTTEKVMPPDSRQYSREDVIRGMAELNRNGIVLWDIGIGNSVDGHTKICNIESAGLFLNDAWIKQPSQSADDLPDSIPFKTDSWVLGKFLYGKPIPKRFLRSQNLLNRLIAEDPILTKLLQLDPDNRSYTWDITNNDVGGCSIL